jgi:hypothetical protein
VYPVSRIRLLQQLFGNWYKTVELPQTQQFLNSIFISSCSDIWETDLVLVGLLGRD